MIRPIARIWFKIQPMLEPNSLTTSNLQQKSSPIKLSTSNRNSADLGLIQTPLTIP